MAIAWTTVSAKVLAAAKRRRKLIVVSLVATTIMQVVLGFYRDQMMETVLPQYGKLGRWMLSYPFAALAAVIIFVAAWLVYVALDAAIDQVESPLVGPRREKLYRPRIESKFLASFVVTVVLFVGIFVYGVYRHYRDPFPNVVALSYSWFAEGYRHNDLYIAIVLKNYSDVAVPVHLSTSLRVFDELIPSGEDESPSAVTIPPWHEHTVHLEIGFKKDAPPPDLQWALEHNGITVGLDAAYNNGKRDVTLHYLGRLLGDHYVPPPVGGQINMLRHEID